MDSEHNSTAKAEKRSDSCCLADLAIANVIVYLEKAEITRSVKYEILQGQLLECTFEQLPPCIEKDSIRIEVPNNFVSIQDVTFNVRPVNESLEQKERLKTIKELIRIEKQQQETLMAKKLRILKQKKVLESFANTLIEGNSMPNNVCADDDFKLVEEKKVYNITDAYNPNNLETIGNFFKLYNDNGERFDEEILCLEEKLEQSIAKVGSFENEIKEIEIRQDELLYRELFIIIEGRVDVEFEMHISYVVNNCSWRPIYDARVSNSTGAMQIYYYGIVKQKTGEDWYEPLKLTLSTAEPGFGGTIPEVGLQKVQFKTSFSQNQEASFPTPSSPTSPSLTSPSIKKSVTRLSSVRKSRSSSSTAFDFSTINGTQLPGSDNHGSVDKKSSSENTLGRQFSEIGTSFEIARPPDIVSCDNYEYRVMIAVINLEPHYQHVTVPKYSPFAYLRSIATNSSKYTLLQGPVNIYMDSNYVGKTQIATICPCEEFYCNLGVDRAIKVNYKPMFKYRDSNNQKSICVTFKQEIQVNNNHERPIKIVVVDQLPVSNDDKIKVTLLEPIIKNMEKYDKQKPIRINANKQLEWDCEIGSNDKKELILKFSVEHPYGRDIEVMQIK